jgi:uncharacterized protein DUF1579
MKTYRIICYSLALGGLLAGGVVNAAENAASADKAKSQAGAAPDNEETMKKWQEYAMPGAGHKILESLVGEWNVESRFWIGGPGGEPSTSKGSAKVRWLLGNRYVQEEFSGEMMSMPFQGIGTTGYDNFKKKYLSTWIDSMGTGILVSEGTADASGKVLTFLGKMDEPATGQKDKPTKYIIRILGPDKREFEMHDLSLGEKSKVFEMTYTRKS